MTAHMLPWVSGFLFPVVSHRHCLFNNYFISYNEEFGSTIGRNTRNGLHVSADCIVSKIWVSDGP